MPAARAVGDVRRRRERGVGLDLGAREIARRHVGAVDLERQRYRLAGEACQALNEDLLGRPAIDDATVAPRHGLGLVALQSQRRLDARTIDGAGET